MQQSQLQAAPGGRAEPRGWRLGGAWLGAAWIVVAALLLGCLVGAARALVGGQEAAALAQAGLSGPRLPAYFVALELLRLLIYTLTALLIIWRRPRDPIALSTAVVLCAAGACIPSAAEALAIGAGAPLPADFAVSAVAIGVLYLIFPDGRLTPAWGWLLVVAWAAASLAALLRPGSALDPATWPPLLQFARAMFWVGCGLAAQIYRYTHVASASQRRQTQIVIYGAAITFGGALAFVLLPLLLPGLREPGAREWYALLGGALRTALMLALPLSMAVAVLRRRLWDVDPLLSRTLLYGALTLCVAAIYVLVVGGLSLLFQTSANPLIALVATGVTAALFQGLRERLQRLVNRLIYGERDEPYAAMARLGRRLEDSLAPQAVLPTLVETIAQSLRTPYVAISLRQEGAMVLAAEYPPHPGEATPPPERLRALPLAHQGELIGQLLVAPRGPDEPLAPGDLRLLADLARQAGAALHALRLEQELQRTLDELQQSRERLVTAREAERRRLRRDLHDGVGPTLASLIQRIDRARALIPTDPAAADGALTDLKGLARTTLADIRSMAYALRPPALDELGLVGALRQHIAAGVAEGLQVSIEAPDEPLPLSAAVEAAAYRIALEALTNVARHAQASRCRLRLALCADGGRRALRLEVWDNGIGLPAERPVGVGLTAMAERAAELGGALSLEAARPRGTHLTALLPLT